MVASRQVARHLWVVSDRSSTETTDQTLADAIVKGELWALECAWKRYSSLAFGLLERGLGAGADIDALGQDVFLSLASALKRAPAPEAVRKCVISLTARRMLAELRRRRVRRLLGMVPRSSVIEAMHPRLDRRSRLALARLHELMDELGPSGRTLLALAEFEGIGETDIAEALGWSLRRVVSRLSRARKLFEHSLAQDALLLDYIALERHNRSEISEGA